jgi:transposase
MSAAMPDHRTFHMIEAVADRLEGAPRQVRRHWSNAFKAQAVAATLEPGASVSAIARGLEIHPSQLFTWRRMVAGKRQRAGGDMPAESALAEAGVVEIVLGDVVVRLKGAIDETALQRVIRAVRLA